MASRSSPVHVGDAECSRFGPSRQLPVAWSRQKPKSSSTTSRFRFGTPRRAGASTGKRSHRSALRKSSLKEASAGGRLAALTSSSDRASRRFYRQALAPFGVEEVELEGGVGWGPPGRVDFFIRQGEPTAPLHLAFAAPDRATVDAFHAAALDAGATDNGPPGLRPHYHP